MLLELPNKVGSNEKACSFEWELYEMHTVFLDGKIQVEEGTCETKVNIQMSAKERGCECKLDSASSVQ